MILKTEFLEEKLLCKGGRTGNLSSQKEGPGIIYSHTLDPKPLKLIRLSRKLNMWQ
jgi:hypothetical protein